MQVLESRDVYTFSGETCILPIAILKKAQQELLNWNGLGLGVMEMSHRSKEYVDINNKANDDLRQFLNVPQNYKILLMQGGATLQYAALPMNILQNHNSANYLVSGYASNRAYVESQKYGEPNLVSPLVENFQSLPKSSDWNINKEGAYFYYTDNETVNGLEFKQTPDVQGQILCSDMTSSLGTKQIDISKYGVIFASAQKNLGPAGVTIVIVRDDLIGKQRSYTPNMFSWKTTLEHNSIFNTSPCFAVYLTGMYVDYMNKNGGVPYFEDLAKQRSAMIYDLIDSSHGFYVGRVTNKDDRSRLNVLLDIKNNDSNLQENFLTQAEQNGLLELRGHQSTDGIRISMFNGMPLEGVQKLRDFMKEFMEKNSS